MGRILALWSIGLLTVGTAALAPAGETDDRDLSGTWLATSMERDGRMAPEEARQRMRFRFEGGKLFLRGNFSDDREEECAFSTDGTKAPKHLDFTPSKEKKPILAIYERNDRVLKVCLRHASSDQGRPTEFRTTPGSDLVLIVFSLEESGAKPAATEVARRDPLATPDEISAKAKLAASAKTTPEERFRAVSELAVSGYTKESAEALAEAACDKSAGETTRDYAAMGLGNFTRLLPDESRKAIQQRLRAVLEREKGDIPDGIIRTLIAWNDAPFIRETLGEQIKGHGMEIEVLASLPGKENRDRLWQLYQEAPKGYKSALYNRKASIGRSLVDMNDTRGIDILVDLLPPDHAPGHQYRHNVFVFLAQRLNKDFGYKALNYDPALEMAIPQMVSWWKENRDRFELGADSRKQ